MKTNFKWIYALFLVMFVQFSFAQSKTVTGTVTTDGQPLPGVTVVVKGTNTGTQTDFDGKYSINVNVGQTLEFSYIGMKTQPIAVSASTSSVNITMQEDTDVLDGVVVQAYRTTTREKSNIASTTVSSKNIEARPNASFIQTLQGQVPGLNISSGSGQPGANSQVILRGIGSVNGKVEPLYVIDGMPLDADNFRSINPDDIENITVLKDAGATSIYGNRGANGVIIVNTKRGTFESSMSIKYTVTSGFTTLQENRYNMMDARQHLTLQKSVGVGRGNTLTDEEIAAYDINTDWLNYFFRTGVTQNHVLSITSGSKNLNSFTSVSYFDQEGILINTGLKRFNFRNNLNGKSANDKFNYSTNITANFSVSNEAPNLGTGAINRNYVLGANSSAPFISPDEYQSGSQLLSLYQQDGTLVYTPLFLIDQAEQFSNRLDEFKLIAGANASYKIAKDFTLGTNVGLDYTHSTRNVFESPRQVNALLFLNTDQEFGGFQDFASTRNFGFNANTRLNYSKVINQKHTIDASIFTEYYKAHLLAFNYRQNGLDPKQSAPGAGTGFIPFDGTVNYLPDVGANKVDAGLFSYFGQADYDYDSKYGFGATFRRDASYRFAETNRWGTFWSLSGRWNISKEGFMDGSIFNVLKLRASYGTAGNQNILGESIFNAPNLSRTLYTSGVGYSNGLGLGLAQLGNGGLKWETISQGNIGVDFEMMESRLRGSFDLYKKTTEDLYLSVPISAIYGQTSIFGNNGDMTNQGVELLLQYDIFREGDFKLSVNFNGSYNKNEIVSLPNDGESIIGLNTIIAEGGLLDEWYLIPYAGVNPSNGNLLFLDINNNLTETPNDDTDRRMMGKTGRIPVYQGGFGFDASYKGFFFNTLFSYVADIHRLDYDLSGVQSVVGNDIAQFNKSTDLLDVWTTTNTVTYMPAINSFNAGTYTATSDRYLVDASFVRLRYTTFGYTFQPEMLKKTPFTSIKAFAQAENLFTWSKWRGWDAESPRFADQYQYPTPKIISLGLELQF